jgi:hypothetical protein
MRSASDLGSVLVQPVLIPWVDHGIYFIQRRDNGLIKIGHTRQLRARFTVLGGVKHLRLLAIGEAHCEPWRRLEYRDVERRVHHEFRHLHVEREWFTPAPELLRLINEIARTGYVPERFHLRIDDEPRVPRLGLRGPCFVGPLHVTQRKCLERANLLLTVAALVEHRQKHGSLPTEAWS